MSRSRKKTNVISFTVAKSEKEDKKNANKRLRKILKQELNRYINKKDIDINLSNKIDKNEGSNAWTFAKDGKQFFDKIKEKRYYRK